MNQDLKRKIIQMTALDLERVEAALQDHLNPNLDLVREIASHLLFSGGKRLRPLLTIHSARLCGYDSGFEIDLSIVFEYLHAATLLHDDVVDRAETRRGKMAAHKQWSAPKVVLTGDFLMARALDIAARPMNPGIICVIAGITADMSQGEIDQLEKTGRLDLSEAEYLDVIEKKTAVLIQGACRSGAMLAGAPPEKERMLQQYGFHAGMAFQMADDLLDYTGTRETLGKHPGADLREGKLTLPLIYSLARASVEDRFWLEQRIGIPDLGEEEFDRLKEKLVRYHGIEYTRRCAQEHVQKALQYLADFDDVPSRTVLNLIARYAAERKA